MVDKIDMKFFSSIFETGELAEIPTLATESTESTEKFVKITFVNHYEQNLEKDLLDSPNKLVLHVKVQGDVSKIKDVVIIKERITLFPTSFCSANTVYVCSNDFSPLYKYICYQCIDEKYAEYIYCDKNYGDNKNTFLESFHNNIDCASYRIVVDETCENFEDAINMSETSEMVKKNVVITKNEENNTAKITESKYFIPTPDTITDLTSDVPDPELPLKDDEENYYVPMTTHPDQQHNGYDFYDSYNFNNDDQKKNDTDTEVRVIQSTKISESDNNYQHLRYRSSDHYSPDYQPLNNQPSNYSYAENENKIEQKEFDVNTNTNSSHTTTTSNNKTIVTRLTVMSVSIALASIIVGATILAKSLKR